MTKIKVYECNRCEYIWIPKITEPKTCPRCGSPYWNKARSKNWKPEYHARKRERLIINVSKN